MALEIERKFLPAHDGWRGLTEPELYRQGYLCASAEKTVRVRLAAARGFLTVKGPTRGIGRVEFEYAIPTADAEQLLCLCPGPLIEKKRYRIHHGALLWEVDEFLGANSGLVLIEVELPRQDLPLDDKPDWVGREVSGEPRYTNAMLSRHPYTSW